MEIWVPEKGLYLCDRPIKGDEKSKLNLTMTSQAYCHVENCIVGESGAIPDTFGVFPLFNLVIDEFRKIKVSLRKVFIRGTWHQHRIRRIRFCWSYK
jgi:hypothetical protein